MDGKRLIEKIKLRNILSFGDKGEEIDTPTAKYHHRSKCFGKIEFC